MANRTQLIVVVEAISLIFLLAVVNTPSVQGKKGDYGTYVASRDIQQPKGASADIWIYENEINSYSRSDWISVALVVNRETATSFEYFEVGYYQDNVEYVFYTSFDIYPWGYRLQRWLPPDAPPCLPKSRPYNLKIIENEADQSFRAYIDDVLIYHVHFSSRVTSSERIYIAECESTERTNELRGHFWNLMYLDSDGWHAWNNVEVGRQDDPYYARLASTSEFHSTIMGDASLNYRVDGADVTEINAHWFECLTFDNGLIVYIVGPEGYALHADLNHDGQVDIFDMAAISAHWNQQW